MKQVLLVLIISTCGVSQSQAQSRWFFGGGNGGVGTPFSAEQHGIADMVRSEGLYNVLTSEAMINYEDARGKYIDNGRKWTELYMMRKRIRESEKAKEAEERHASISRYLDFRAENPDTPPRLNNKEFDSTTGEIKWPLALKRDCFAIQRKEMEELFASKARLGSTSEISQAVFKKTREIQAELRKYIRDIVTEEYVQARKFLRSLEFEGKIPAD